MKEALQQAARLRELWLKEWKETIQHLSPAKREQWLRTRGKAVLGNKRMNQLLLQLGFERQMVSDLDPSGAWTDAWYRTGQRIPARVKAIAAIRNELDDQRNFSTVANLNCSGMVLSRQPTLVAEPGSTRQLVHGLARRRLVPRIAAKLENTLDAMDAVQAHFYKAPEKGRPLTVKDVLAMGLKERRRQLHEGDEDPYRCEWERGCTK